VSPLLSLTFGYKACLRTETTSWRYGEMNTRTATILVVGILLGGLLVACSSKRDPDHLPASYAQAPEADGQAPPGIKKGVKVTFLTIPPPSGFLSLPLSSPAYDVETAPPLVKDVKGNWVLLGFTPTETAAKNGAKYLDAWVNFNTVICYQTK
jgi:hypothetical protein